MTNLEAELNAIWQQVDSQSTLLLVLPQKQIDFLGEELQDFLRCNPHITLVVSAPVPLL